MNFEKARELMVENQLRPNKIKDPIVLDIFKNTKKEDFLSKNLKDISYTDNDIDISDFKHTINDRKDISNWNRGVATGWLGVGSRNLIVSIVKPPSNLKILALSPHPDDETFGAGGLLLAAFENKCSIDIAFITTGKINTKEKVRNEAEQ